MASWDEDEDDKPKLTPGATYYVVPMQVLAAFSLGLIAWRWRAGSSTVSSAP